MFVKTRLKMLRPVDWANTKVFVEYGPGVGTFTRPILELLGEDATLLTIDTQTGRALAISRVSINQEDALRLLTDSAEERREP